MTLQNGGFFLLGVDVLDERAYTNDTETTN